MNISPTDKSFKTASEAHLWRIEKRKELEEGIFSADSNITFAEYIKMYLKDYIYPRTMDTLKESSYDRIESALRNAVVPALGNRRLQDITPKMLQDLKNKLALRYSSHYVKNILIQLKRALKRAVIWKYIRENPAQDLEIPRGSSEKPDIINEDQLQKLLEIAPIRERAIIGLGGLAGLRISEILGLQWKHIDFQRGTIRIEGQCCHGVYKAPKTKYSIRTVPILQELEPILKEWKLSGPPGLWLFPGPSKMKPLYASSWEHYNFKPLLRKLRLPLIRFHALRHGFNKLLLDRGVPIREAMYIMGHSDPKVTIAVYDRESPDRIVQVAREISVFSPSLLRKKPRISDSEER